MALLSRGMTCSLCGEAIDSSGKSVTFPAFINDSTSPLKLFDDGVFHRLCVARHPHGAEACRWSEAVVRAGRPDQRRCVVCDQVVQDPDDYFGTTLLATDPTSPLYAFNFVHLHQRHVRDWPRLGEFRRVMDEGEQSGRWRGPQLVVDEARAELRWIPRAAGSSRTP